MPVNKPPQNGAKAHWCVKSAGFAGLLLGNQTTAPIRIYLLFANSAMRWEIPYKSLLVRQLSPIDAYWHNPVYILPPGETIEYHWQEYLGDFDLEKGSYTFQLRYVVPAPTDNKYSPLNRYERAWRKNPRLKNTTLFRSELNSRFYSFHLSKDIKRG